MNCIMFNIKELSSYLQISTSLIRKLVRNGSIPYNRIGTKLLFPRTEIDMWLKENQGGIKYEQR